MCAWAGRMDIVDTTGPDDDDDLPSKEVLSATLVVRLSATVQLMTGSSDMLRGLHQGLRTDAGKGDDAGAAASAMGAAKVSRLAALERLVDGMNVATDTLRALHNIEQTLDDSAVAQAAEEEVDESEPTRPSRAISVMTSSLKLLEELLEAHRQNMLLLPDALTDGFKVPSLPSSLGRPTRLTCACPPAPAPLPL